MPLNPFKSSAEADGKREAEGGFGDTDTDSYTYIRGGIGNSRRAVRLSFRPKLASVKRRDRSECPERLLSQAKRVSDATANGGNGVAKQVRP